MSEVKQTAQTLGFGYIKSMKLVFILGQKAVCGTHKRTVR